jgi:hypothetical protein
MLGVSLWQPIQKLLTIQQAFARYEDSSGSNEVSMTVPKLIYFALNVLGVLLALWKCQSLGLLPTSPFDWMPHAPVRKPLEWSAGSVI